MVLADDDRVGDRQPLAGTPPYALGGEKWIEDPELGRFRNTCARISDSDLSPVTAPVRTYGDPSLLPRPVPYHIGYSMRGIHDQIKNHLVELAGHKFAQRKIRADVGGH